MEGLFFIIVIAMIASSVIFRKKDSAVSKPASALKTNEVPASLKARWNSEDSRNHKLAKSTFRSPARSPARSSATKSRNFSGQSGGEWAKREQVEEKRRQTRRSEEQRKAKDRAMARLGDGSPRDKNPNRRHDWGRQGHFGGGWITPLVLGAISAAIVAALFASA